MAQLAAARYANALFELALEANKIDAFDEEVKFVAATCDGDKEFFAVLNHPQISGDEKMKVLESAFKGKISDEIIGLFSVVFKKNREAELIDILQKFIEKVEEHKGIVTAKVSSAKPLSEKQITDIKEKLSQNLNKQVFIEAVVEPSLIGGVCIAVDGHVIDGTIKSQIAEMKKQLLNLHLA